MVIPTDVNLVTALIQTGALGALIWLVIDTRREAQRREERLLNILEKYADKMDTITQALTRLEHWLTKTE